MYIGSSSNLDRRWYYHLRDLKRNDHCNVRLQKAFLKYGINSFRFNTIELCLPTELIAREQYWIDYFDSSNKLIGFNMKEIADDFPFCSLKRSQETKNRISSTLQGRPHSIERKAAISYSQKTFDDLTENNLLSYYLTGATYTELATLHNSTKQKIRSAIIRAYARKLGYSETSIKKIKLGDMRIKRLL
jgi:group I intron endonuclease